MARSNTNKFRGNFLNIYEKLAIILVIVLIIVTWLFVHYYFDNPTQVFNRMLNNTLSTASYTKTEYSSTKSQTESNIVNVQTGATNGVIEYQTLSVPNDPKGSIKITNLGTVNSDYSKYTYINTEAKNRNGLYVDYSSVIGLWGASTPANSQGESGQFFSDAVLDYVPMANINPVLKKQYLTYLNKYKVYNYSTNVKRENINGRSVMIFPVSIKLYYLSYYLYEFSDAVGITHGKLEPLPAKATSNATKKFLFYVDISSGQISEIKFVGSNESYVYSSYGAKPNIVLPKKYIPLSKLETKIQSLINM